jgi:signal transduction histidine kinase
LISVADQGQVIAPEEIDHTSYKFYREKSELEYQNTGTAMRLAIAWGIVEAYGGIIQAESASGRRTSYTFTPQVEMNENMEPPARIGRHALGRLSRMVSAA